MSLLDEARDLAEGRSKGPDCSVTIAMREHPDLADDIADVIRARDISGSVAQQVFVAKGINVSKITVERHRQGNCRTCTAKGVTW